MIIAEKSDKPAINPYDIKHMISATSKNMVGIIILCGFCFRVLLLWVNKVERPIVIFDLMTTRPFYSIIKIHLSHLK